MNLAKFSIENNRIILFLLFMALLTGLSVYSGLPRDSMPPFTVRVATVVSDFPGASPERVELLVTDKIEKVAQELPELKEVSSTSRTGLSVVTVQLKDEVTAEDLQSVWDRLRRKLDSIEGLPSGVTPRLNDDDIGVTYGIAIALTSDGFSYNEMKDVADDIRDELIQIDAAAKVEIHGAQQERIFIEFDDARLAEYGLTASKLSNILSALNIVSSGGQINLGTERINLEPTGNFASLDDVRRTLISVGDGDEMLQLGDITSVRQGYADPASQVVYVDGKKALSLHVSAKEGANITKLGKEINDVVDHWMRELPIGLDLKRIVSMDTYIEKKVSDFVINLVQSISIILIVMLLFLGLRTGLVIASLIPTVTIMTVLLMSYNGLGLNQVTLAALIMALGMMVDNAIVVAESIQVKMEEGIAAKAAAMETFSELWMSLLISTLTSSVAFLAFFLAESQMGDIVGPIFLVITYALGSSWLAAMCIITLLCYYFLRVGHPNQQRSGLVDRIIARLKKGYESLMIVALGRKVLVLCITALIFGSAIFGFRYVEFLFFPGSDRNLITIDINLPLGTRIETTEEIVKKLSSHIENNMRVSDERTAGITGWSSYAGEGPASYDQGYSADEPNSSYAHILVNTSSFEHNSQVINELDEFSIENFPEADILVSNLGAGPGGTPIELKISGNSPAQLNEIGDKIKLKLLNTPGTRNVKDDWGPKSKKFIIKIDQPRSQGAGITSSDIAMSLQTTLDGVETGEYREGDKTIPIYLKSNLTQQSLQTLESMSVFAQSSGASVPLLQVAKIIPAWQYAKIKRRNLERTMIVSSELTANGNASAIMADVLPWLEEEARSWPEGYTYTTGGDAESTAESMGAVLAWLPMSGIIIVLLLVVQFNSFRKTFMVLTTIPMVLVGVCFGLLVFQKPFGFMPFLGLISLAGIVINNAIVLLDRISFENTQLGRPIQEAIIHSCLQRFRPILLATFTTVLGLIPLYISGGAMWEGMAISIICGLLFGTLITLILIPCLYSVLYRVDFSQA